MSGLGWNLTALGAGGAAIAVLIPVARGLSRRRRRQSIARRDELVERRIEFVAIDDVERGPKRDPLL
jgi:hypothetical protein